MNKLKKVFKIFILFSVLLIQIFSGIEKPIIKAQGDRDATERYGITNVKLKDFNYYERTIYHEGAGSHYHWYGSAFDFDFALPANVKKGEYFTLTLPPELILSNLPMYTNSETVPYDRLDEQPNKYGRPGMQKDNVFFTIKDKATNNVILKVYYTKENELTFVVQESAENKGPIKGSGTVGDPVDLNELKAYTGIDKRKYLPGNRATNDNSNVSEEQVNSFPKLWEGIRPNKELLRPQAGSTANYKGILAANTKNIKFKTRYKKYKEFYIDAKANINYSTELSKTWKDGNNALVYNDFGKESFQVIKEDRDYLYFAFYYMSNKGENRRRNERTSGKSYEIYGRNQRHGTYGAPASTTLFPITKQYLILDRNSIVINKVNRNTPAQAHVPDTVGNPIRVTPPATGYSNKASGRADGFNGTIEFERAQHNNQNSEFVRFNFNDNTEPHYITFRMRKNETNDNGHYLLASHIVGSTGGFRRYAETYERTMGFASATVEPREPEFLAQPSLKLLKTDTNGNILRREPGKQSPVQFKATDEETQIEFYAEIGDDGKIHFPSLIRNHNYILEETRAEAPFKKSDIKYRIVVDGDAKIKIFKLDQNNSNDQVVDKYTSPLSINNANDAEFRFSNSSNIKLKIRKIDSSNKLVTGSKALFYLYKPNKFIVEGNTVVENGERPIEISTTFNGRYGVSEETELAPSDDWYALKEVEAPDGTKLIDGFVKFKVNSDGSITFENNKKPAYLDVSRTGTSNEFIISNQKTTKVIIDKTNELQEKLGGVTFELLNENGQSFSPAVEKSTNGKGELIFDGLTPGNYLIKEKQTLNGYKLLEHNIKVTVDQNLNVTTQNVDKLSSSTIRNSFRNISFRSSFLPVGATLFSVGSGGSLDFMPQPPYHLNVDPNTIKNKNTIGKQTITEVSPGRYKVDVEVNGENQDLDVIFVVQGARYENNVANNREIIKAAFSKIKELADKNKIKANVAVFEEGVPGSSVTVNNVVLYQNIEDAINNNAYNNVKDKLEPDGLNGTRNMIEGLLDAGRRNKDNPTKNKIIIQILERPVWGGPVGNEKYQIESNNDQINKVKSNFSHYIVWGKKNGTYYYNPGNIYRDVAGNVGVAINDTNAYKNEVNKFITNHPLVLKSGKVDINLANNVRFDGWGENESIPNIDKTSIQKNQNGQNITITGIKNNGGQPYRFSYYIRSNQNSNLNNFENINSSATYSPDESSPSTDRVNLPIPKVLNPGLFIKINKEYTAGLPEDIKADSKITLTGNNSRVSDVLLKSGTHTFGPVAKFDNNGVDIRYDITDTEIKNNLVSSVNPTTITGRDGTVNILHSPPPFNLTVNRNNWENIDSNYKKDWKLKLRAYVDGKEIKDDGILNYINLKPNNIEKNLNISDNTVRFENLKVYTPNGDKVSYSVEPYEVITNDNRPTEIAPLDKEYLNLNYEYSSIEGNNQNVNITVNDYLKIPIVNKKSTKYKFKIAKVDFNNVNTILKNRNSTKTARLVILDSDKHPIPGQGADFTEDYVIFDRGGSKYEPGIYYIKEERAPEGYKKFGKLVKIEITSTGEVKLLGYENENDSTITKDDNMATISKSQTDSELIEIKVKNKQKKYPIKIVKIKANGDKITNSDTRFVIKSANSDGESDIVNIGGNQSATFRGEYTFNPGNAGNEGFPPGTYYIREITAPNGYKLLNRNIKVEITEQGGVKVDNQDISVGTDGLDKQDIKVGYDNNGLITLQVKNKKLFNLHIKKRVKSEVEALGNITSSDQLDGTNRKLTATFNLQKENGTNNWQNISQNITTNNGYNSVSNLEEGKYRLVETTAPDGYIRLDNPVEFTVNSSGVITLDSSGNDAVAFSHNNSTMELVVAVKNEPIKYQFKVRKLSKRDNSLITNADHNKAARILVLNANKQLINGQSANLTTGEQLFDNRGAKYEAGTYYLKEERAPDGYDRLTKLIKIEITNSGQVNFLGYENENNNEITNSNDMVSVSKDATDPSLILIEIKNKPFFGMSFQKIDATKKGNLDANSENNNKSLVGAKIKIKPKSNDGNSKITFDDDNWNINNVNGEYSQDDGGVIWISNNNHVPGFKITEGTYSVEEIQSPNGYEKFIPFDFTVSSRGEVEIRNNTNPQGNIVKGNASNRIIINAVDQTSNYDIKLYKVDKDNPETHLANSRFKISKDAQGNNEAEEKNIANVVIPLLPDGSVDNNGVSYWDDAFNTDSHHSYGGYGVGLYYLTEMQAPNGYKAIERAVPFYINSNGTVTIPAKLQDGAVVFDNGVAVKDDASDYAEYFEAEVRNDYKWSPKKLIVIKAKNVNNSIEIKLKKVLENNENTTIDGVKFKFFRKHATENKPDAEVGEFTTANGGIITIPNINPGEYFIKETEVPQSVNNNSRALYKLNDKYYKLNVAQTGRVTFADKALIREGNNYSEVDKDNDITLGDFEDRVQNITFKNKIKYKVTLEKNLYTVTNKPRIGGPMKFYIKPQDEKADKIEVLEYRERNGGYTILNDKVIEGKSIAANGVVWRYDTDDARINPIFSLEPGSYTVEEFNLPGGYEKVVFNFSIDQNGTVRVEGFENQTTSTSNRDYGFADGNIFLIKPADAKIHIFNKKPMEIYLNKVDQNQRRISKGNLKLKLAGAKVFNKAGQDEKVDEFTLDLSRNYVNNKGIKIRIPKEIKSGTYILSELEAPVGYAKTNVRYHIQIDQFLRTVKLIKTDTGENTAETLINPEKVLYSETYNGEAVPNTTPFDIVNKQAEYPATGGFGTIVTTVLGLFITAISSIMIYRRKRQN